MTTAWEKKFNIGLGKPHGRFKRSSRVIGRNVWRRGGELEQRKPWREVQTLVGRDCGAKLRKQVLEKMLENNLCKDKGDVTGRNLNATERPARAIYSERST